MKSFVASALLLCVVAVSVASAQYHQQAPHYQQRKLAPQAYGASPAYRPAAKAYAPAPVYSKPAPVQTYSPPAPVAYHAPAAYAAPAYAPKPAYHPPNPFAWGYDINDGYGGAQFHKETGDEYGKRTGSYGYTDAYGVYRQVDYVADEHGFRAVIKSNEPGVSDKPSSPADVELQHYEPPTNHYAAAAQEYHAPAPVAAYQPAPKAYPAPAPAYPKPAYRPQQSYSQDSYAPTYRQPAKY